jgi:GMP synthase-like glutamine amidotransferase
MIGISYFLYAIFLHSALRRPRISMTQRICALIHANGEGLGSMESWFTEQSYPLNTIRIDLGEPLPPLDSFDWLVVMGGPMGVYEQTQYPWLTEEINFLRQAIGSNKKILGICLGGQLIASALGAKVYPNSQQEIGWHPIIRTCSSASWLPDEARLLSWHGDRFDLPEGANAFAASAITPVQGFSYGERVWALQFHVEAEEGTVGAFFTTGGGDLPTGDFVQSLELLISNEHLAVNRTIAHNLLRYIAELPIG